LNDKIFKEKYKKDDIKNSDWDDDIETKIENLGLN
jgi:hypothetical protein